MIKYKFAVVEDLHHVIYQMSFFFLPRCLEYQKKSSEFMLCGCDKDYYDQSYRDDDQMRDYRNHQSLRKVTTQNLTKVIFRQSGFWKFGVIVCKLSKYM